MLDKHVAVIGAGVSGMASALELANAGFTVSLVEREPQVGGHAALLCCKATHVCSACAVCTVHKLVKEVATHPRVRLLTNSLVQSVTGAVGDFHIQVGLRPTQVDAARCIACGVCSEVCPTSPKAAHILPMSLPLSYTIDERLCTHFATGGCDLCRQSCPTGAISFDSKPNKQDLVAHAIVLATGFEAFDAKQKGSLGYGRCPNVLTGLDMEKAFRQEGALRLADGREPRSIAFIQCVGSRDESVGSGYCSQVCCKYAMRLARLLKYQNPHAQVTIFYIDLQTAGKGFSQFYREYQDLIRFIRGIPVEVSETPSRELELKYEDISQGKVCREMFDVVVLSVGISPRKDSWDMARILGINLADNGFFDVENPLDNHGTNVNGIFLAGACQGPKDIPDSISHGIGAASEIIQALGVKHRRLAETKKKVGSTSGGR
ncbi:MAG: FAD-dependent oxidoreductase [Thermodesulfobacteriota bacterium]